MYIPLTTVSIRLTKLSARTDFRESTKLATLATEEGVDKQEAVLGETALEEVDDAADHVPNVIGGLKA